MPTALTWVAKFLPLTHALAVMRYGLLGDAAGLHNIWGSVDPAGAAALSLTVTAFFAVALTIASVRIFTRSAVR